MEEQRKGATTEMCYQNVPMPWRQLLTVYRPESGAPLGHSHIPQGPQELAHCQGGGSLRMFLSQVQAMQTDGDRA